uniref:DUF4482 domain-containing protein n=1 Tax=Pygocentrus nattereri TaxID=42514 RepID=A0AAR2LVI5_PYGNA
MADLCCLSDYIQILFFQVAKSVSLRLHSELEAMQKKSSRLEWENEELRERLQDLDVAKQVLQTEIDKSRENSLKRRSSLRSTASKNEKRLSPQEDSADLKCQLHFAKEESALMCKKLTKMAVECESMREELAKYRLLYGDVDSSQAAAGTTTSAHTREAEVKVHLRLVEEEATLLSRRIVELEVENRGLRAEMSEMRERAGGGQEDEDEVMEGGGERLAMSVCVGVGVNADEMVHSGHPRFEETNGSEHRPLSQILREGPVGGERDPIEDQENSAENTECAKQAQSESGCSVSLKDLEALLAIRDQAMLVTSTIQLLMGQTKNGLTPASNHSLICDTPYLSKKEVESQWRSNPWLLDPMLSPLTSGLEVLQAQLCALVARLEVLVNSASTEHESKCLISETGEDTNTEKVLETGKQESQKCPTDYCHSNSSQGHTCDQDSMELLTLQLRWFLQQWRQGERPTAESKSLFEVKSLRLFFLCYAKEIAVFRNFCLCTQLEGTSGRVVAKGSPDLKVALQKDHVEKLQHLLAESYAAVMDLTRQLKVCERNWNCEKKELLKHLSQARLDWDKQNKTIQVSDLQRHHRKKKKPRGKFYPHNFKFNLVSLMDREDPCKTWDCPVMRPSFPGLNQKQEAAQKSHTAPERTALRIYYSPPSASRIHLSAVTIEDQDDCEELRERQEQTCHLSSSQQINGDSATLYENWLGTLPLECHSAIERDPIAAIRSSSSGFQPNGISSPSCLPFALEVSANMSDDMKEMTASVLQSSHPSTPERRRGRDSGSHIVAVISTGTQTHTQPQMNSVGLQTEGPRNAYAGKHWSPRVTSFVSGRTQPISTSLERMPGPSDRLPHCSTSPKLQRSHSTSKERGLWSLSQSTSGSSAWGRSSTTRPNSASGRGSDKPTGRKSAGIHKYGLVQEFFRNVCGRGEKPSPGGEKAPVVSDSVTKIVNRRFMKPGQKDEPGPGQTQGQSQNQANKTPFSKDKGLGPVTLEDGSCDCSSRTLASCFARASRTNVRHAHGHCKLRPHDCPTAAGGKGDPLPQ